jgi:hypothetical protein
MNTLYKIYFIMLCCLYGFIICHSIWDALTSYKSRKKAQSPLTGTEPKPEPMYPLTKSVLVNESAAIRVPLHKPDSLGYVKALGNSELATKKEGGK